MKRNKILRVTISLFLGLSLVTFMTSPATAASELPGDTWTPKAVSADWQSVASSADGTKLVAVEWGGNIYVSTDSGDTWAPKDSARNWRSVASSADGTKLVAVVEGGQIYISNNSGNDWDNSDSDRLWRSVASSADGTKLVAVASGGKIYVSPDSGITWTPNPTDPNRNWQSVASSADGTKLVAVVSGGKIYVSNNSGISWILKDVLGNWESVASSADGTKLVAVEFGGKIYVSTDSGNSWAPNPTDPDRVWRSVASSADGTKLVAGVEGGQIYTSFGDAAYDLPVCNFSVLTLEPCIKDSGSIEKFIGPTFSVTSDFNISNTPDNGSSSNYFNLSVSQTGLNLRGDAVGGVGGLETGDVVNFELWVPSHWAAAQNGLFAITQNKDFNFLSGIASVATLDFSQSFRKVTIGYSVWPLVMKSDCDWGAAISGSVSLKKPSAECENSSTGTFSESLNNGINLYGTDMSGNGFYLNYQATGLAFIGEGSIFGFQFLGPHFKSAARVLNEGFFEIFFPTASLNALGLTADNLVTTKQDYKDDGTSTISNFGLPSDGLVITSTITGAKIKANYGFSAPYVSFSSPVSSGSSGGSSTIVSSTGPQPDYIINRKVKKSLSKVSLKSGLAKKVNKKFVSTDKYKYSIFGTSKKVCKLSNNYIVAPKKPGVCEMWVTRTTKNNKSNKYWVRVNYIK